MLVACQACLALLPTNDEGVASSSFAVFAEAYHINSPLLPAFPLPELLALVESWCNRLSSRFLLAPWPSIQILCPLRFMLRGFRASIFVVALVAHLEPCCLLVFVYYISVVALVLVLLEVSFSLASSDDLCALIVHGILWPSWLVTPFFGAEGVLPWIATFVLSDSFSPLRSFLSLPFPFSFPSSSFFLAGLLPCPI